MSLLGVELNKKQVVQAIIVTLIVILTLLMVKAEPINVACNASTNFSYWDNNTNTTAWQEFFCQPQNETIVYVNISDNVTLNCTQNTSWDNWTETVNISLDPGQFNFKRNTTHCFVNAECNTESLNSHTCDVSRVLQAGEVYQRINGPCNLDLECNSECPELGQDEICMGEANLSVDKKWRLDTRDDTISFSLDGVTRTFRRNDSAEYEGTITLKCPADLKVNSSNAQEDLMRICSQTNPYLLGWLDKSMTKWGETDTKLSTCVENSKTDLLDCQASLTSERETNLRQQGEMNGTNDKYNACLADKSKVEGKAGWYMAAIIFLCITTGCFLILALIGFGLYWRAANRDDPAASDLGGGD